VNETWDGSALVSAYLNQSTAGEYVLTYKKNHITKRKEGTVGVFAFATRKAAEAYLSKDCCRGNKRIVKALGFGRMPTPPRISYANYVIELYKAGFQTFIDVNIHVQDTPRGTVVYEALSLLEGEAKRRRIPRR
jgi:hypothetical protein